MTEKDRIKEFLERAHDVHGRQYGYSMVTFPTTSGKVAIVCPTHGVFYQEPSRHLAGAGCRACADAVKGQKRAKEARATFTQRAKALHGDKYDITNTGYFGDVGTSPPYPPGDFAASFEAFLDGHWYTFDPRNNVPVGRVLLARGRDAADVAMATTFGRNTLESFRVWTEEVADGNTSRA